ncbi:MAG TPA: heterodisulfide reductase-related iron-sulfur binding cluster [Acidiferrobacteraceae bacterium]|nr:heterodisulfide reductase-related iron-sulfur binding cluster [Acidiferrobacteraceae bacterium]
MSGPRDPSVLDTTEMKREGSVDAPTRHPIPWQTEAWGNEEAVFAEMHRVFDICHGCRRCFNLCQSFPTLFDLIDESSSMDLEGVARTDYWKVVDQCYLCDMCYMTKCPYVPPHPWNVDFPHLMLRGKALRHRQGQARLRDRVLTSTDAVGRAASLPVVVNFVNTALSNPTVRKALDQGFGIARDARLPRYHHPSFRGRWKEEQDGRHEPTSATRGRVVVFATCYGNYNDPQLVEDLVAVLRHNGIGVTVPQRERCCGMPKLELGDLDTVQKYKDENIPELVRLVDDGWDILAPVPSCVLMFKQELPLLFPDDEAVQRVRRAIFDPFEYLALRHREGKLDTGFRAQLGRIAYHVACHQRVQNIGLKTREVLELVPGTQMDIIERCSGHDGTYAVKSEHHADSMRIGRPVFDRVRDLKPDYYMSDCPIAGQHIEHGVDDGSKVHHPLGLLRLAYGI